MVSKGQRWCYGDETVRQCVPDLGGGNRKSSAADGRKSEGWYNETVGARGAEWASSCTCRIRVIVILAGQALVVYCLVCVNLSSFLAPSSSVWAHLSYGLVRSKREYYHNCTLVVYCVAFCSCTLIWAAHSFCLPDLASSHWVHSLCLGYFVGVRLFSSVISACMLYYCNTMRW